MTSNALIPVSDIEKMAAAVAKSGLFGVKTPDAAMALMLIAQAEGLHPAIAARDYHIINGKPSLKADAMMARFQTAGGSVKWNDYTDSKCNATVSHPQGGSVTVEWTIDMAKKAGLTTNPTWAKYPRQMLRARVISEGIRTVYPGIAVGVYTPEEVQDFDKTTGEIIDVTPSSGPTTGEITAKQAYGSAKAMKERHKEITDALTRSNSNDELEAVKVKYKPDFANMKSIDQQLFDDLVSIGERRRIAINGVTEQNKVAAHSLPVEDGALTDEEMDAYEQERVHMDSISMPEPPAFLKNAKTLEF